MRSDMEPGQASVRSTADSDGQRTWSKQREGGEKKQERIEFAGRRGATKGRSTGNEGPALGTPEV